MLPTALGDSRQDFPLIKLIRSDFSGLMGMLLVATIGVLLAGCSVAPQAESGGKVTEYTAILATLEASRREIRELSGDIAELRKEIAGIRSGTGVVAQAPAPAPLPPAVTEVRLTKTSAVLGSASAQLAIVEFTDYECPFCERFNTSVLPLLKSNYLDKGTVKIISRNFPLAFHANARGAALAATCAAEQGAYAAMRAGLFAAHQALRPELYTKLAGDSGLDMTRFAACTNDAANARRIQDDFDYASSLGVSGTPSFFIGRIAGDKLVDVVPLVGALPYESFAAAIDSMLPEG
jgi:protein-disulfide isomerase